MRPDVKLGIVVSIVFVTVAGTYFLVQDRRESTIPVSSDPANLADAGEKAARVGAKPEASQTKKPVRRSGASPAGNPATPRTASRRNSSNVPTRKQPVGATPTQDRRVSRPEQLAANTDARRGPTTAERDRRSRDGLDLQRKTPSRRQPKPQLALTATPTTGIDTAIERHRVQHGDTMTSLAKQYYGSTQFAQFLVSRNKHLANPSRPRVGEIVNIVPRPPDNPSRNRASSSVAQRAQSPTLREYRVKSGDSFYRIARDVLGDAKRWNELFEMNKKLVGNDATKLQIGQVIALPQK